LGTVANDSLVPTNASHVFYEHMIAMAKECRDAIIKKVQDEKLLEKWYASERARAN